MPKKKVWIPISKTRHYLGTRSVKNPNLKDTKYQTKQEKVEKFSFKHHQIREHPQGFSLKMFLLFS